MSLAVTAVARGASQLSAPPRREDRTSRGRSHPSATHRTAYHYNGDVTLAGTGAESARGRLRNRSGPGGIASRMSGGLSIGSWQPLTLFCEIRDATDPREEPCIRARGYAKAPFRVPCCPIWAASGAGAGGEIMAAFRWRGTLGGRRVRLLLILRSSSDVETGAARSTQRSAISREGSLAFGRPP
jgi:hypothetical protein